MAAREQKASSKESEEKPKLVQLRLKPEIMERIDAIIQNRSVPPSRHFWILEAVMEKIEREEEGEG